MNQEWVQPKDADHQLFAASSDVKDSEGHTLVTAYAVLRPDGQWSLMLINKDYDRPHQVHIVFQGQGWPRRIHGRGHNADLWESAVSVALRP